MNVVKKKFSSVRVLFLHSGSLYLFEGEAIGPEPPRGEKMHGTSNELPRRPSAAKEAA